MLFFIISIRPRQVKSGNRNFRKLQRPDKGVKEEGERHLSPFAKGVLGEAGRPPLPPEGGGGECPTLPAGQRKKGYFCKGSRAENSTFPSRQERPIFPLWASTIALAMASPSPKCPSSLLAESTR